jgi:Na+-transporting methylmalonyl-CoA/oxaloacetate decarboxylase gamma subunit
MLARLLSGARSGSEIQKALFVMVVGVVGVFLVLAFFYALIRLLRRVLKK